MARGASVNVEELPEDRQAEIAEQVRRHEIEAEEWKAIFDGLDGRVLSPMMAQLAKELAESDRWGNRPPRTEPRLSGSGVKSSGQFKVPAGGPAEESTRPMDVSVELFPTTNQRFIAYLDVGGKVERKTFEVSDFEENQDESDERFKAWLNAQFDKHIRKKAYH